MINILLTGALSNADEIIDICFEYVKKYDHKFDHTKTVRINYWNKTQLDEHVVINSNIIE